MGLEPSLGKEPEKEGWGVRAAQDSLYAEGWLRMVLGWRLLPIFLALTTGTKCPTSGPRQHSCCDLGGAVPACTPLVFSRGDLSPALMRLVFRQGGTERLERSPTFPRA